AAPRPAPGSVRAALAEAYVRRAARRWSELDARGREVLVALHQRTDAGEGIAVDRGEHDLQGRFGGPDGAVDVGQGGDRGGNVGTLLLDAFRRIARRGGIRRGSGSGRRGGGGLAGGRYRGG